MRTERLFVLSMLALSFVACGPAPPPGPRVNVKARLVDGRDLLALVAPMREYHGDVAVEVAHLANAGTTGGWDLPQRVAEIQSLRDRCRAELVRTYGDRVSIDENGDLVVGGMTVRPYFLQGGHVKTGGDPRATAWDISCELPFQMPTLSSAMPEFLPGEPDAPPAVPWVVFGWKEAGGIAWALTPTRPELGSGLQFESAGLSLLRRDGPGAAGGPRADEVLRVHELPSGERRWVLRGDPDGWVSANRPMER